MSVQARELTSDRLALTPLIEADADEMVVVLGDQRMHEFTGGTPSSRDELRDRYRRLAGARSADGTQLWFNSIVRLVEEGAAVGVVQATVTADGRNADVAWEVGVAWQGRGIASEAASMIVAWLIAEGVHTIRACIHPDHDASARVAARAGLAPTAETVDGEIVWRRTVADSAPERCGPAGFSSA